MNFKISGGRLFTLAASPVSCGLIAFPPRFFLIAHQTIKKNLRHELLPYRDRLTRLDLPENGTEHSQVGT
jgi:hypothetical protein